MPMVEEAEGFFKEHFSQELFNRKGWEYIVKVATQIEIQYQIQIYKTNFKSSMKSTSTT